MDDEQLILLSTRRIIKTLGHECVCVKDGEKALEAYREAAKSGQPFDAVIMDLFIPGDRVDGFEAIKLLKKEFPDALAIVSSGHRDIEGVEFGEGGFNASLPKPFDVIEIEGLFEELFEDKE